MAVPLLRKVTPCAVRWIPSLFTKVRGQDSYFSVHIFWCPVCSLGAFGRCEWSGPSCNHKLVRWLWVSDCFPQQLMSSPDFQFIIPDCSVIQLCKHKGIIKSELGDSKLTFAPKIRLRDSLIPAHLCLVILHVTYFNFDEKTVIYGVTFEYYFVLFFRDWSQDLAQDCWNYLLSYSF